MTVLRTRFAPSPTGELHLGGARTALFCYLLAKKNNGVFVLRFEDTDRERSREEFMRAIQRDLHWLGMTTDEGPYYQSKRLEIYTQKLQALRTAGFAYPCFCTEERLTALRKDQERRKLPPRYDGLCSRLAQEEIEKRLQTNAPHTYRFKIAASELKEIVFEDLVHGKLVFKTRDLEDFIIMRGDGTYPFLMVSLIDDLDMKITHILRGDDHLSNTPKQILIAQALKCQAPLYGHLPLVLNEKGAPLSKREGDLAIESLRLQGFLPEAVTQSLMLLGWSPPSGANSNDAWTLARQIELFSLEHVSHAPARCDFQRLRAVNRAHLKALSAEQMRSVFQRYCEIPELAGHPPIGRCREILAQAAPALDVSKALQMIQEEVFLLDEIPAHLMSLVDGAQGESPNASFWAELREPETQAILKACATVLSPPKKISTLDEFKATLQNDHAIAGKQLFRPFRLALTGRDHGPKMADLFALLGQAEILRRLRQAIA